MNPLDVLTMVLGAGCVLLGIGLKFERDISKVRRDDSRFWHAMYRRSEEERDESETK